MDNAPANAESNEVASSSALPRRVTVKTLSASRYESNSRPDDWSQRVAGIDTIVTEDGETLTLKSSGQQSPPKKGWILLLRGGDAQSGFEYTLYGFAPGADVEDFSD